MKLVVPPKQQALVSYVPVLHDTNLAIQLLLWINKYLSFFSPYQWGLKFPCGTGVLLCSFGWNRGTGVCHFNYMSELSGRASWFWRKAQLAWVVIPDILLRMQWSDCNRNLTTICSVKLFLKEDKSCELYESLVDTQYVFWQLQVLGTDAQSWWSFMLKTKCYLFHKSAIVWK